MPYIALYFKAFYVILFVNYLGKMRGYPQFSFWISITLVKIYIPCVIINGGKNTIELVGTVLNKYIYIYIKRNTKKRKLRELEQEAETKRAWAIGLCFIPFTGAIASPLLGASADSAMANAVAKGQEAKIQEAASMAVSEALIPALENFINGIKKAAGFFSVMEQELMKFENRASNAVDEQSSFITR